MRCSRRKSGSHGESYCLNADALTSRWYGSELSVTSEFQEVRLVHRCSCLFVLNLKSTGSLFLRLTGPDGSPEARVASEDSFHRFIAGGNKPIHRYARLVTQREYDCFGEARQWSDRVAAVSRAAGAAFCCRIRLLVFDVVFVCRRACSVTARRRTQDQSKFLIIVLSLSWIYVNFSCHSAPDS